MFKTIARTALTLLIVGAPAAADDLKSRDISVFQSAWVNALLDCVPGTQLERCLKGIEATSTLVIRDPVGTAWGGGWLELNGTFRDIHFMVDDWTRQRIGIVKFIGDFNQKSERRKLLQWVKKSMAAQIPTDAFGDCGYHYTGPAWQHSNTTSKEVALALEKSETLRAGRGKNLDRYFLQHTNMPVALCFLLPKDEHGYLERSNMEGVMRAFIQSEFFAGHVTPKKPPE